MYQHTATIILLNANKDVREEAKRLKKSLERYEFFRLVVIMSRVLSEISIATHYLQRNLSRKESANQKRHVDELYEDMSLTDQKIHSASTPLT